MKRSFAGWLAVVSLTALPAVAAAQDIDIAFDGYMTDAMDLPITDTLAVELRIYDDETGGEELHLEVFEGVVVESGFFSLKIGSTRPFDLAIFDVAADGGSNRFVALTVVGDGVELTPRFKIGFVPFAIRALNAGTGPAEVGPAGPMGEAGAVGPAGEVGPVGPIGAQGEPGPVGVAGPQGDTGAPGPVGPTGLAGDVGPIGPAGPDGAAGLAGIAGPMGPMGLTGPAGPDGDVGPAGADGPAGAMGIMGVDGAIGPAGAVGPPGLQGIPGPPDPNIANAVCNLFGFHRAGRPTFCAPVIIEEEEETAVRSLRNAP